MGLHSMSFVIPFELDNAIREYIAVRKSCQSEWDLVKNTDPYNARKAWEPEQAAYEKFIEIKRRTSK